MPPAIKRAAFVLHICGVFGANALFADAPLPSFNCAKADSSSEEMICADAELAALDNRLANHFQAALLQAEQIDAGSQKAVDTLRATQRGWIKGRDECWKSDDQRNCVKDAYLIREGALVAEWLLQAPVDTATFSCEGNPANEVTVYVFDTPLPSIRLEYGDSIRSGSLVPTGSGTKYDTGFGSYFWSKKDSALFSWTQGTEMTCVTSQ